MDEKNLLIEILMNHITSVTLYHDKEGGRTSQANIIFLQRFDELADKIIAEGFSRRPELDRAAIAFMIQETVSEVYRRDEGSDMIDLVDKYTAKFTAPEAKPASSVNAEVVKALNKISESTCMDCTSAMIAEQALNSIKAGKDAKCS